MTKILVVDNDFLDKLAKIDRLNLLRMKENRVVVTDKVYEELRDGADKPDPAEMKAIGLENRPDWKAEYASPERTAQLNAQDLQIIDKNLHIMLIDCLAA
jgi:predicted nucleic acid-binding protein